MGKKQHQKDKMYLTTTEWSTLYGGKQANRSAAAKAEFRRLPFDHCALSLQPFENPYCDQHGNVFDLMAIHPFHAKFKCNPITGEKMDVKSLTKLKFHKNAEGEYHCPVMFRTFTENSHIVAIKQTGNVFSFEAIEELNIKAKYWRELLEDAPFTRSDIITIQDPSNLRKFNLENFHHLKKNLKIQNDELERAKTDPLARIKSFALETKDVLDTLNREYKPIKSAEVVKAKADSVNAAHYSTGEVAASFTSTSMGVKTVHEAAIIDEDTVRYERIKKKGYVRLTTSAGAMNLELYCDQTPKACENFILLCQRGFYVGTKFHRSIKHFMIQGGDPTGTGTGGESAWGKPFGDEIRPNLHHAGRGMLSMANSGPGTNKSQFFITYRSCKYLDGKHTVFGHVVGGLDTLSQMEKIETDNKDRPLEDIVILKTEVFASPYEEVDAGIKAEREKDLETEQEKERAVEVAKPKALEYKVVKGSSGVGKYLQKRKWDVPALEDGVKKKALKSSSKSDFNFSNW